MDDILSIQEFSKLSGVEASTLRYWDEIGIFTPLKRDPDNKYRYYSSAQLLALNFVTVLSALDIPLKTIAELRRVRDPEMLLTLLEKQEQQMDMEMRRLRLRYSIIHARRELINLGAKADEGTLAIAQFDEKPIILWPRNEYNEGETFIEPLSSFISQTSELHINLSFPVGGCYDSMEGFTKFPERPDYFISVDPTGKHTRKAGEYLVGYARGYYGDLGDLPGRMLDYANEQRLNLAGPVYTLYLFDETCVTDPSQYLAQCSIAVSRHKARDNSEEERRVSIVDRRTSNGDRRRNIGERRAF